MRQKHNFSDKLSSAKPFPQILTWRTNIDVKDLMSKHKILQWNDIF